MNRTSTLKSRLRLACLPFFLAVGLLVNQGVATAQPGLELHRVFEFDSYLSSLLGSEDPEKIAEGVRLHELVESLIPTVFITNGSVNAQMGNQPSIISVDQISMGKIQSSIKGNMRNQVEMISISLSNPSASNQRINTMGFSGFSSIKYLLFTFNYPLCSPSDAACEIQKVKDLLLPPGNPRIVVLYRVAIPM